MLFRNLIYTGLARAKKLAILVGTRKALVMAVKNKDTSQLQTYQKEFRWDWSQLHEIRYCYPVGDRTP